jgi:hypothetical protein
MERQKYSLILVVLVGVGCGGRALDPSASAKSDSFFPTSATKASGEAPSELWWRYSINGGAPVPITSDSLSGTMQFSDEVTVLSNGGTSEHSSLSATARLTDGLQVIASSVSEEMDMTLMAGPPSAIISQTTHQEQQLSAPGVAAHISLRGIAKPTMPITNFADRPDLDQLPIGHVDELTTRIVSTTSGSASANGRTNTNMTTSNVDMHRVWTIVDQLPSLTVRGKTYERVVKIEEREDDTNVDTFEVTSDMVTRYFAVGIGLIKAEGSSDPFAGPVTIELVDTNLGAQ